MRKWYKTLSGILALSLLLLLCGCAGDGGGNSAGQDSGTESSGASPVEEDSVDSAEPSAASIEFEGTALDGNTISEAVFSEAKLTMINVWATYCGPCLSEMPGLGELAAEYDTEEFQIIGIVSDVPEGEDSELARSLVQQTGANYPHLLLNDSIGYALLTDVTAVPTTFFFDSAGTLLDSVVGAMEKTAWEEIIHGLLEAQ